MANQRKIEKMQVTLAPRSNVAVFQLTDQLQKHEILRRSGWRKETSKAFSVATFGRVKATSALVINSSIWKENDQSNPRLTKFNK